MQSNDWNNLLLLRKKQNPLKRIWGGIFQERGVGHSSISCFSRNNTFLIAGEMEMTFPSSLSFLSVLMMTSRCVKFHFSCHSSNSPHLGKTFLFFHCGKSAQQWCWWDLFAPNLKMRLTVFCFFLSVSASASMKGKFVSSLANAMELNNLKDSKRFGWPGTKCLYFVFCFLSLASTNKAFGSIKWTKNKLSVLQQKQLFLPPVAHTQQWSNSVSFQWKHTSVSFKDFPLTMKLHMHLVQLEWTHWWPSKFPKIWIQFGLGQTWIDVNNDALCQQCISNASFSFASQILLWHKTYVKNQWSTIPT